MSYITIGRNSGLLQVNSNVFSLRTRSYLQLHIGPDSGYLALPLHSSSHWSANRELPMNTPFYLYTIHIQKTRKLSVQIIVHMIEQLES